MARKLLRLTLLTYLALGLSLTNLAAQPNKVDGALHSFLNSEFMVKMNDMKIEAEAGQPDANAPAAESSPQQKR